MNAYFRCIIIKIQVDDSNHMSHLAMMILAQMLVPRTCSVSTMKLGVTLVLILTVAFSCLVVN